MCKFSRAKKNFNNENLSGGSIPNQEKRLLGTNPANGLPVYAMRTRIGYAICESNDADKTKSRFANITSSIDKSDTHYSYKL